MAYIDDTQTYSLETRLPSHLRELLATGEGRLEYVLHTLADLADASCLSPAQPGNYAVERALNALASPNEEIRLALVCALKRSTVADQLGEKPLLQRFPVETNPSVRLGLILLLLPQNTAAVARFPLLPTDDAACRLLILAGRISEGDRSPATLSSSLQAFLDYSNADGERAAIESYFYQSLSRFPLAARLDAFQACLEKLRRREDVLEAARYLLCMVFRDTRSGWENRLLTPESGWNSLQLPFRTFAKIREVEYWNLSGDAPETAAPWTQEQRCAATMLLASSRLWRINTNLWTLFGFSEGRVSLARVLDRS